MSQAPPEPAEPDSGREPPNLEQVLERLESAVRRLADQSAPLERMVADWEQAQALARDAERRLQEIEGRLRSDAHRRLGSGAEAPKA